MQPYDGSYTGVTKEITFSTGGSSKVEINNVLNELKFTWKTGDLLYVYGSANNPFSGGEYCGTLTLVKGADTENGFFSGTLDNVPTSGTLRFYYSATALNGTEKIIDLSSQDGSLNGSNGIVSHLVAYADVAVKPDGGDYSATLAVPYSIVKFDLSAFGSCNVTMTGITNSGLTISAKGVKDVKDGTSTTLSGVTSESNAYYVAVMPESVTKLNFSGNSIVVNLPATLTENTFQTFNNGGDPVPVAPVETDEWINFNDKAMDVTGMPIWAKKNLGATCSTANPTNPKTATTWFGDYYAWGEIETYYKSINLTSPYEGSATGWKDGKTSGYRFGSNKWCRGYLNYLTKYNTISSYGYEGYVDNKTILDTDDDAARAVLHGTWRMPTGGTSGEWKQLKDNTLFVWTTSYRDISDLSGYVVYKVKAKEHKGKRVTSDGSSGYAGYSGYTYALTDPHMFIPAAGRFEGTSFFNTGYGRYWSSSLNSDAPLYAWWMKFKSGDVSLQNDMGRYNGFSVRPVRTSLK